MRIQSWPTLGPRTGRAGQTFRTSYATDGSGTCDQQNAISGEVTSGDRLSWAGITEGVVAKDCSLDSEYTRIWREQAHGCVKGKTPLGTEAMSVQYTSCDADPPACYIT